MRIFSLAELTGTPISDHGSRGAMLSRLAEVVDPTQIVTIRIEAGGGVGRHTATSPQLFIVIQGQGEVSGEAGEFVEIRTGQAVHWNPGESHETRTNAGLTAIVVEGVSLQLRGL